MIYARRLLIALSLASLSAPAVAGGWDTASRVGEVALVGAALGVPVAEDDWSGLGQSALTLGGAAVVAEGLKQVVDERRPDGSGNDSFPSGHAAISFAAAGYLEQRYGWRVGLPATIVAIGVGVARVEADKHHWYDIAASAVIGEGAALIFTRPLSPDVRLFPWGDAHGGGMALAARF